MEEELNENDLEERLYAMIHHVDETQVNENALPSEDASPRVEAPRSTVRRYWRTSYNSEYQKINTSKDAAPTTKNTPATVNRIGPATNKITPATVHKITPAIVNKITPATVNKITPATVNKITPATVNKITPATINKTAPATLASKTIDTAPKEEKNGTSESPLLILKDTLPQNYEKIIEILEIDEVPNFIELETSDEDEVIEVALPPKPTITIESSDDELTLKPKKTVTNKANGNNSSKENKSPNNINRNVSTSPVPSVVSTMSDDFIRGDCIALNISSAQPDNESFDFSLHGSDLLGDGTSSKKKRKKKCKDRLTSTSIAADPNQGPKKLDNIFATPKSKGKNKKQKTKSYAVSEKSIPNADVYDSDSNQSIIDTNKTRDAYIVTDVSFPSADVYESDSSVVEKVKESGKTSVELSEQIGFVESSDSNLSIEISMVSNPQKPLSKNQPDKTLVIDLSNDSAMNQTWIEEDLVIGNVSGFRESKDHGDGTIVNPSSLHHHKELGRFCSTNVPQILFEDLDFDNLKGKDKVCKRRRYSLTTLRAEMEKFYNESWGGENFNHQEIQKNMSRDKSLWVIDPKDRMPNPPKRRVTCNFCNRPGHRDDSCRFKPPVCFMCGHTGHYEPRCPWKICVNCGSPNFVYSKMCRNCSSWARISCAECSRPGHPASHCPDLWRRYHNTIDENMALESSLEKAQHQQFCSGCARRGHLVHSCRAFVPFCSLPIPSPHVARYWRTYPPVNTTQPQDDTVSSVSSPRSDKRRSKTPTLHATHVNKKRVSESGDDGVKNQSKPQCRPDELGKPASKELGENTIEKTICLSREVEKALDYIPITSINHDKRGHVIQDNEVSDTSEVMTSARIYITTDIIDRLRTLEGQAWLRESTDKLKVHIQPSDSPSFLTIRGTSSDQEAFQLELREWLRRKNRNEMINNSAPQEEGEKIVYNMPKKKNDVLRTLGNAFNSLKRNIGDPKLMYKELVYLRNNHESLLHQKVVSPAKLNNNRDNMNVMMKKLNMVLLGQVVLAGGARHLTELYSLQESLINIRQQKVPIQLRQEISRRYQNIFTAVPRDDYAELIKKFYISKQPAISKKKMNNYLKLNPKNQNKNFNKNLLQKNQLVAKDNDEQTNVEDAEKRVMKHLPSEALKNKLVFFRRRLQNAQTDDCARDQRRLKLVHKLHQHISRLCEHNDINSKGMKKMRKTQEQAKMFLTDL